MLHSFNINLERFNIKTITLEIDTNVMNVELNNDQVFEIQN